MAFDDTSLGGYWCSAADCCDVVDDLPRLMAQDEDSLARARDGATGYAQSIMRSRYPNGWPFESPPAQLRQAVAAIAVFQALRRKGAAAGESLVTMLKECQAEAVQYINRIADSEIHVAAFTSPNRRQAAHIAKPPRGELGFSG